MTNEKINSDVLLIDKNALDRELIQQAQKFYEVAEAYAEAVSRKDAAYENIKQVDADLYFEVRTALDNEGVKVTESMVSQRVLAHADHLTAHANFNQLKLESDKLAALKEAFAQRSYMIRDLVQLHTTGYYTETSLKGGATSATEIAYMNQRQILVEKKLEKKEPEKPELKRTLRRTVNS